MACSCVCTVFITVVISGVMYSIISHLIPDETIIAAKNVTNSSNILSYEVFRNVSYEIMFDNHTDESISIVTLANKVNSTKAPSHKTVFHPDDGCSCKGYGCSCCETLCVPEISLNDTGCLNFAYLPDEYGISVSLTIDGYVIINETISAKSPPPICMEPPFMDNFIHICIRFYDLEETSKKLHGCVRLEMRMFHIFSLKEWDLGCFNINLLSKKHGVLMKKLLENTSTNTTKSLPAKKPSLDWKAFQLVLLSKMNSSDSTLVTSDSTLVTSD